jgi:Citrate lyase beta subunit
VLIRVNSLDTPWWIDDVGMAGKARPDGILVPKISSVADLNAIANRLSDINADVSIRVWAMIETSRAVLDATSSPPRRRIPRRDWPASCSDRMISRGRRGSGCSRAAPR